MVSTDSTSGAPGSTAGTPVGTGAGAGPGAGPGTGTGAGAGTGTGWLGPAWKLMDAHGPLNTNVVDPAVAVEVAKPDVSAG